MNIHAPVLLYSSPAVSLCCVDGMILLMTFLSGHVCCKVSDVQG